MRGSRRPLDVGHGSVGSIENPPPKDEGRSNSRDGGSSMATEACLNDLTNVSFVFSTSCYGIVDLHAPTGDIVTGGALWESKL